MSSMLRSSKFVRYFVGLARNIVISNRQDVDGNLLQRSQHLASVFSSNFSSNTISQVGSNLDQAIRRLDEEARRVGRITKRDVEEVFNEIRSNRRATTSQSLMVIRCCGNLVPEEAPEQRTKLVQEIWNTLEKLGVPLDISHYNALLKVYLENEHKFSPTEFLENLEKQGVEPNRVTYQRLIAGYCQLGDIAGATKILEFMKEKQLPVSEGIFNALVLGHSQADDMESAEGILCVMKQANLEPSNETYSTLLCGYAKRGDQAVLERLIKDCKLKDILLSDKDILEVAYAAAVGGHSQLVDEVLKNIKHSMAYNQEAANMIIRLITKGKDDVAYKVFLTMLPPLRPEHLPNMSGHVIIKQLVKTDRPAEQIVSICNRLEKDGHTPHGLFLATEVSFHHGNIDLTLNLIRALREKGMPIRGHYFWPSLLTAGKAGDFNRLVAILNIMGTEFNVFPTAEAIKDYYLPYTGNKTPEENMNILLDVGVSRRQTVIALVLHLLSQQKLKQAVDLAMMNVGVNLRISNKVLVDTINNTGDVKNTVALVHIMTQAAPGGENEEAEESDIIDDIPSKFLSALVFNVRVKDKVAEVLKEMVECGLSISSSCAELVESRLQGNQLTTEVSGLLAKLSAGDLSPIELKRTASVPSKMSIPALERTREKLLAENGPVDKLTSVTRNLYSQYCQAEDLENALKIKEVWEHDLKMEVTPGLWAQLMMVYCAKGDLPHAKECMDNIKASSQEFELDSTKVLKVAKLYVQNNQFDDAINLLTTVKPRGDKTFQSNSASFQLLEEVADVTKDPVQVKKMLDIMGTGKFVEINNILLGPIMKAYLMADDINGALKEFERCVQEYRATPWKNDLTIRLIEKEDPENLQRLVDLSTQVHGEINSLYDLVLAFVECGRIRQARKILQTPGLRNRSYRLNNACERYKNEGLSAPLEGLVEATKDLPHIDRSEIYYNLLETYCKTENVDKAIGLWTQMQDEDVSVTDEFLVRLGEFLQSKGHAVPFNIPKGVQKREVVVQEKRPQGETSPLAIALKENDLEEALKITKSLDSSGATLSRQEMSRLVELLAQKNRLEEAVTLVTSATESKMPFIRVLKFLILGVCQAGKMDLMKQLENFISDDIKRRLSFSNHYINCAVAAGTAKEELNRLEELIDNAKTPDEIDTVAQKFPRGGIYALLSSSPSYHEQVIKMVEKYDSKDIKSPANCLCMYYLCHKEFDKAKEIFKKYNLANNSRIMFRPVLKTARIEIEPQILEELISMVIDAPSITPEIKGLMYSNLIRIYLVKKEAEQALAKLDEALSRSVPLESIYNNTLTHLKQEVEAKNIPFNYTIPQKQKRLESSTSSSSSSDVEPQKSVAAKH